MGIGAQRGHLCPRLGAINYKIKLCKNQIKNPIRGQPQSEFSAECVHFIC